MLDSLNDKEMFEFQKSTEAKALHAALLKFRPIKTEREILIDIITSTGNLSEGELADAIISAGFTNNKEGIN